MKGWKKTSYVNSNQKRAGLTIFILDKIDFKSKTVIRDTVKHYMMIKVSIHQKDIIITNIYAPNSRAPKHMKQILTEPNGETDSNIIIIDFNTLLSIKQRSSRQKINKERDLYKLDLTDIYIKYSTQQQNTLSFEIHKKCSPG